MQPLRIGARLSIIAHVCENQSVVSADASFLFLGIEARWSATSSARRSPAKAAGRAEQIHPRLDIGEPARSAGSTNSCVYREEPARSAGSTNSCVYREEPARSAGPAWRQFRVPYPWRRETSSAAFRTSSRSLGGSSASACVPNESSHSASHSSDTVVNEYSAPPSRATSSTSVA